MGCDVGGVEGRNWSTMMMLLTPTCLAEPMRVVEPRRVHRE
jgi:hypothetical protein